MRTFIFLLCTTVFSLSTDKSFSQDKIKITEDQTVTVDKVFEIIKNQTNYNFIYRKKIFKDAPKVQLKKGEILITELLKKSFSGSNVKYKLNDEGVIIIQEIDSQEKASINSLQGYEVSGTIRDQTGLPLAGANIVEKEVDNNGAQTDFDGNFSLTVRDQDAILVVTYIGFVTKEIPVNGKTSFTITLEEDTAQLDEIVIVGYGAQKKVNLTGAVGVITAEEINDRPVIDLAKALQGADPSVNLTFNTGVLDSGYNIDVRGSASLNRSNPLVIADGIEVNLNQINPNDIESISVLKDISSAAIYGARASAGVILITTKSGKNTNNKVKINFNTRTGFAQNTTSTDFITTGYDHVSIVNQFYEAHEGRQMLDYNAEEMQMLYDRRNDRVEHPDRPWVVVGDDNKYRYYGNFDWFNYFYRKTRPENEHNISISGGNDKTTYFVSGRQMKQDGIYNIYHDNMTLGTFRTNLKTEIKPWLRYTSSITYSNRIYKYAGRFLEQGTVSELSRKAIASFVPRNPDGSIVQYPTQFLPGSPIGGGHGGFLTADNSRNSRGTKTFIISNQFDFDLRKDLSVTMNYAYKYENRLIKYRSNTFEYSDELNVFNTYQAGSIYDYYREQHRGRNNHNINLYTTYNPYLNDNHNLKVVVGTQYEEYRNTDLSVRQYDLLNEDLSTFAVGAGEIELAQSINAFKNLGFFGRLNYDYKGKYLFEVSGRFDGTSRFRKGEQWGFFPSASLGWRMSEEGFWKGITPIINNSKLRLSYGSLGNQQVDNYATFDEISPNIQMDYTFDGISRASRAGISDPISSSLTWETVSMLNAGLDLSFLNNRLNLTYDYYIRDTKDMLQQSLTLPAVYGADTPTANTANLQTKGWELDLSWKDQFNLGEKPFKYNVGFTLGDYVTKVTKYNNPDKLIDEFYVGQTLGEMWGYKVAGLFASDEYAAAYQAAIDDSAVNRRVYSGSVNNYLQAGDVEFIDLNGDNVINEGSGTVSDSGDKRIVGNSLPRYSYSFRIGANWKGFEISAFFQGVAKQDWFAKPETTDLWGPFAYPGASFIHKDFASKYWTEETPNAYFPRPRGYQAYAGSSLNVISDRYLQDVSYLRLKNLTIGYTIPFKLKGLDKVKVYATGENLFYWSKLKRHTLTIDPELTNTNATYDANTGLGYFYSKTISLGVNISM
ncbi:TonB-dependent receptor [Flavivirga sp. 57AJ16]|uniref:SusC/RagA family TonB-linked outer membrane protein n=1 Tax=Flavivirga sp. 57AJ16 TaxID=3025307 RepID=UPI0023655834|nr:TonB-dependent receptor [Flavivirga sp. 57AJ16]MDD7886265.1 TonB-dependent receptor [Flavivirga sp. 57AJ16]